MSKKHYEALAKALRNTRPTVSDCGNSRNPPAIAQWERTRDAIITVCEASNPAFNRARFIKACAGE